MIECSAIRISEHALVRMFNRGIRVVDVKAIIQSGEIIANYPTDKPYPSCLLLGYVSGLVLHVVLAQSPYDGECIVVTAYVPNETIWESDFKTKKKQ